MGKDSVNRTITRLSHEILETHNNNNLIVLIGIHRRGVFLASRIKSNIKQISGFDLESGSLDITFHRDDLVRVGTRMVRSTDIPSGLEGRQVVLVDDVIFTGRTVRAALEALQSWGRAKRVMLVVMVDRGHREVPIQPDFCGRTVPTSKDESIDLRLSEIDGEEGIYLCKSVMKK